MKSKLTIFTLVMHVPGVIVHDSSVHDFPFRLTLPWPYTKVATYLIFDRKYSVFNGLQCYLICVNPI